MTTFKFQLDSQRQNTYMLNKCDNVEAVLLPADTLVSIAVPQKSDNTYFHVAVFAATNNFMVGTQSFTLPTSGAFTARNEQMNVPSMALYDGNPGGQITQLFFRAPAQCYVYISFYDLFIRDNNPTNT